MRGGESTRVSRGPNSLGKKGLQNPSTHGQSLVGDVAGIHFLSPRIHICNLFARQKFRFGVHEPPQSSFNASVNTFAINSSDDLAFGNKISDFPRRNQISGHWGVHHTPGGLSPDNSRDACVGCRGALANDLSQPRFTMGFHNQISTLPTDESGTQAHKQSSP